MKAVVAAFNQEKALVGAFSVITNPRMELFEALDVSHLGAAVSNTSPDEQNMKLRRESVIFGIMKINLVLPDLICNSSHHSYLRQSLEIMMGV